MERKGLVWVWACDLLNKLLWLGHKANSLKEDRHERVMLIQFLQYEDAYVQKSHCVQVCEVV